MAFFMGENEDGEVKGGLLVLYFHDKREKLNMVTGEREECFFCDEEKKLQSFFLLQWLW